MNEDENEKDRKIRLSADDEATEGAPKVASEKKPEPAEAEAPEEKPAGVGGFFRRLFKRNE